MVEREIEVIAGAAYWASYLINGDASGLTPEERALADAWLERCEVDDVVDVGESYFSWHYGAVTGSKCNGGDLAEYTVSLKPAVGV